MRNFPFKMIVEAIQLIDPESITDYKRTPLNKLSFERIEPWNERTLHESATLYTIPFENITTIAAAHRNLSFLAIKTANGTHNHCHYSKSTVENVVITQTSLSQRELTLKVRKQIEPLAQWVDKLQESIMAVCTFQELFDISEPILKHWGALIDNSFQLMAYTKNHPINDPSCKYLIEHGFHSKETSERILMYRAENMKKPLLRKGLTILTGDTNDDSVMSCSSISQPLYERGTEYAHLVVALEDNAEANEFFVSTFRIFADYLQKLLRIRGYHDPLINQPYRLLFSYITNDNSYFNEYHNDYMLEQAAKSLNIDTDKTYVIGNIQPTSETSPITIRFCANHIKEALSCQYVLHRKEDILMLLEYDPRYPEEEKKRIKAIDYYLKCHDLKLFLSAPCHDFGFLSFAYLQAKAAARTISEKYDTTSPFVSRNQNPNDPSQNNSSNVFFFSDIFLDWLLLHSNENRSLTCKSIQNRPFGRILHDQNYGKQFLNMIVTFIQNERNGTKTSQLINMHRSSLLYNISKCEREFGISFDDYGTRLEFMFLDEFCKNCRTRLS